MSRSSATVRPAPATDRRTIVLPAADEIGMGHLLGAALFAAVTALLSAAAIILGLPGLDRAAIRQETSVWGVLKEPPPAVIALRR